MFYLKDTNIKIAGKDAKINLEESQPEIIGYTGTLCVNWCLTAGCAALGPYLDTCPRPFELILHVPLI